MTMLSIYHGDPLEDFVLHISTVFGSLSLGFQLLPGHIGFLLPRDHLSNSDSVLTRLNDRDHQEDTALPLNIGVGGAENIFGTQLIYWASLCICRPNINCKWISKLTTS